MGTIHVVTGIGVVMVIALKTTEVAMEPVLKTIQIIRVFAATRAFHGVIVAQMRTALGEGNASLAKLGGIAPPTAQTKNQPIAAGLV